MKPLKIGTLVCAVLLAATIVSTLIVRAQVAKRSGRRRHFQQWGKRSRRAQ